MAYIALSRTVGVGFPITFIVFVIACVSAIAPLVYAFVRSRSWGAGQLLLSIYLSFFWLRYKFIA
jgi:hypothetical protein